MVSLQSLRSLNEYTVKYFKEAIPSSYDSQGREIPGRDIQGDDKIDSEVRKYLETYDKDLDEAILASECLVDAYNESISAHFDKAISIVENYISKHNDSKDAAGQRFIDDSLLHSAHILYDSYVATTAAVNGDKNLAKQLVIGAFYQQAVTEESVQQIIKSRLEYNKTMVAMYQRMIKANARVLGITEKALSLITRGLNSDNQKIRQTAIKATREQIVAAVKKDYSKYEKNGVLDLRPLGLGCAFVTKEYTGLENIVNLNSLLQHLMEYDAIVFGHGEDSSDAANPALEKLTKANMEQLKIYQKCYEKLNSMPADKRDALISKKQQAAIKSSEAAAKRLSAKLDKLKKQGSLTDSQKRLAQRLEGEIAANNANLNRLLTNGIGAAAGAGTVDTVKSIAALQKSQQAQLEYLSSITADKIAGKTYWSVQPIYTLNGGPYTKMDDLIRQLYKEGFKKIYIMSCNPGHHELSDDLKKIKDLHITMGRNTVMIESVVDMFDEVDENHPLYETVCEVSEIEYDLRESCQSMGIDYDDDKYLKFCYTSLCSETATDVITEAGGRSFWGAIWERIKKLGAAIVYLFKKILQMVAKLISSVIDRLKSLFSKGKGPVFKIRLPHILVENAKVAEKDCTSVEDIHAYCTAAAKHLTTALNKAQAEQLKTIKSYEALAKKNAGEKMSEAITLEYLRMIK